MDKKSLTGILLIVLLFLAYGLLTREDPAIEKTPPATQTDSTQKAAPAPVAPQPAGAVAEVPDSLKQANLYGPFLPLTKGEVQKITVRTQHYTLQLNTRGGTIETLYLNEHKTSEGKPLPIIPVEARNGTFFSFASQGKIISTKDLFFTPDTQGALTLKAGEKKTLRMKAQVDGSSYLEQVYTFEADSWHIDWQLRLVNMKPYITGSRVDLVAQLAIPKTEKDISKMLPETNLHYRLAEDDDVEKLEMSMDEEVSERIDFRTKWVSFKSQFFSLAFIAGKSFEGNTRLKTVPLPKDSSHVKYMEATLPMAYAAGDQEVLNVQLYAGPNNIRIMDAYGPDLDRSIALGWGPLRYVTLFIIWVFHLLEGMTASYGLIILILAIFIKVILLPLTLKSHTSTVKMQIVNNMPEMKELEARYKESPTELQQRKMAFYKQVGVSPFGGCLPMLLQFPILIAMFNFFPVSIELRQQGLFWADDLSTYDSIWTFGYVPVINTIYGDHVSLFTLLMTISTLVYSWMQQRMQGSSMGPANMKWLVYIMPIMFLGILNNYSAGLSYYYLVFNLLTIAQTYILKAVISKEALEAKVHELRKQRASKPAKQGRMARWMESQQKKQQQLKRQQQQQRRKK
ncbi:MAG: membrane protein insertase YidC [Bacteroidetes bacterium]|nr:membrane protein insertase YidC [Bacteroidota bacterium]